MNHFAKCGDLYYDCKLLPYWKAASKRIEHAEKTIPLDDAAAWEAFWDKECDRQSKECERDIRKIRLLCGEIERCA